MIFFLIGQVINLFYGGFDLFNKFHKIRGFISKTFIGWEISRLFQKEFKSLFG